MKRLIVTVLLMMMSTLLSAEEKLTLKAVLIICDDYVSAENNAIADGVKRDKAIVEKFLARIEERKIVNVETTLLEGKMATTGNVRKTLSSLKVGKNDILFVYFSGHGGMENNKTFLFFCDDESMGRDELEKIVSSKNARLTFLISDACSSSIDSVMAPKSLNKKFTKGLKDDSFDPVFRELFYSYTGLLHVTAAKEGQYATGTDNGGLFTIALINECLMYPKSGDWQQIIKEASESTNQKFKKISQYSKGDEKDSQDSQNPQVYKYPVYKGKDSTIKIDNKDTTPGDEKESAVADTSKRTIIIINEADFAVSFFLDRNVKGKKWSVDNLKKYTLKPGKDISFDEKGSLTVYYNFLQNGKKGDSIKNEEETDAVELEKGEYIFDYDKSEKSLEIYSGDEGEDDRDVQADDDRDDKINNQDDDNDEDDSDMAD